MQCSSSPQFSRLDKSFCGDKRAEAPGQGRRPLAPVSSLQKRNNYRTQQASEASQIGDISI